MSSRDQSYVGSSYLIQFYNDVQQLSNSFALVMNRKVEFFARYPELDKEPKALFEQRSRNPVTPAHSDWLLEAIQNFRHYAIRVRTAQKALQADLKVTKEESDAIDKSFKSIKDTLMPKDEDMESYIDSVNLILVTKVVREIIDNANDIYERLAGAGSMTE